MSVRTVSGLQIQSVTTIDKTFFARKLGSFHGKVMATCSQLPQDGKCVEIAKRVGILAVSLLVYSVLLILSAIERCVPLAKKTKDKIIASPPAPLAVDISSLKETLRSQMRKAFESAHREAGVAPILTRKINVVINCNGEKSSITLDLLRETEDPVLAFVKAVEQKIQNRSISTLNIACDLLTCFDRDGKKNAHLALFTVKNKMGKQGFSHEESSRTMSSLEGTQGYDKILSGEYAKIFRGE